MVRREFTTFVFDLGSVLDNHTTKGSLTRAASLLSLKDKDLLQDSSLKAHGAKMTEV